MDPNNPVVQLCIQITQAEYAGRREEAHALARRAWEIAGDDAEACMAAHYLARFQATTEAALHWNEEALRRAESAPDGAAREFLPSLYLSLGRSYEQIGKLVEAQRFYQLAADLGFPHQEDGEQ